MPQPTMLVECAFVSNPLAASPTWTDITSKVQQIAIRRGRDNELARYQAGTATLIVDNRLRHFDPTYDSGPYYPYVLPGRRIRIRANNGTTYPLFDGFVESWPQEWESQKAARVPISAVDAFKMLNLRKLPGGYAPLIRSHSPQAYWQLDETSGSVVTDSSGNGLHGGYFGSPTFAQAGAPASQGSNAVALVGPASYIYNAVLMGAYTQLTVEIWVKTSQVVGGGTFSTLLERWATAAGGDVNGTYGLYQIPSQLVQWNLRTSGGLGTLFSSGVINTGAWKHIVGTWNGTTLSLYIDGVLDSSGALGGTLAAYAIGQHVGVRSFGTNGATATFDEIAIYNVALNAHEVYLHYAAATGAVPSQLSSSRVTTILDTIGWPTAERDINGGTETLQASTLTNMTVFDHLQSVGESEAGRLFMNASGQVRFDGRDTYFLPPYTTTLATFGDNPLDSTENKYTELVVSYDDSQIWNDVRLTRTGGTEQAAGDTTSQETYGIRTLSKTGLLQSTDNAVLSVAQYYRNQYKDPQIRFKRMTIRPNVAALWEQVLARDIGDRVRVGRRPQGLPPAIAQDSWIEGVEHDIRPSFWETRWSLSKADIQQVWILGDATYGLLGSTTRLSF